MLLKSSVAKFCMGCALVMVACGLLGTSSSAQTSANTPAKKTDTKKAPAKKDDSQAEDRLEALVIARLKEQFKKEDINGNNYLDKSELINWLGLVKGPDMLKKYDKDGDGKLSLDEFTEWATAAADAYAKETMDEIKDAESRLEKAQQAYAKASADQKQKYQQAIQRERQQLERARNRRNDRNDLEDRLRRLVRR